MRKICLLLFCLIMMSGNALALDPYSSPYPDYMGDVFVGSGFAYTLDEAGHATIVDYTGERNQYYMTIPSSIDDHPVKRVHELTFSDEAYGTREIVLEEGIEAADKWAFMIPYLQKISLPISLIDIEDGALSYVDEVYLPDNHPIFQLTDGALYNKKTKSLLHYNRNLTGSFTVPKGILTIGNDAFYGCKLSRVILPEGLQRIGYNSFATMYELGQINLPDSLTYIDPFAFHLSSNVKAQYTQLSYAHVWLQGMPSISMPKEALEDGSEFE